MAHACQTTAETETVSRESTSPTLHLKLQKPENGRKVEWATGTVDNEDMNKKKSKCCCIYRKPRLFGESSSESDEEGCTDHCRGHKKKCFQKHHGQPGSDQCRDDHQDGAVHNGCSHDNQFNSAGGTGAPANHAT